MALPLSERQLALDILTLYGVLVQACSASQAAQKVLLRYKPTEDGILAYDAMIAAYDNEGHKTLRAEKAEAKLQSAYTPSYPGGLSQFVDDYQTAFAVLHGECGVYYSDETQKRKLLTNLYHDSTRWLVHHCRADPSLTFQQCCDLIQQDALRHDLRSVNEATASARTVTSSHEAFSQILNTMKTNTRFDDAAGLTFHPALWQLLTPEMRTTLTQLRKTAKANIAARRQQTSTPTPGTPPSAPLLLLPVPHSTASAPVPASTSTSLPSQYGNRAAQQVTTSDDIDSDDDEYEEEVSTLIQAMEAEYELRNLNTVQTINVQAHVDYLDRFAHLVANSAYGPTICVSDSGADTTVIGEGWHIDHLTERRANLIGFDKRARKEGLPIVTALTIVQTATGTHLLRASDVVYNQGSRTTLLSEFQLREHGCLVDSVLRRHDPKSTQSFCPIPGVSIPFRMKACLMTFPHRLPTAEELTALTPIDITPDMAWYPQEFYEDTAEVLSPMPQDNGMTVITNHTLTQVSCSNDKPPSTLLHCQSPLVYPFDPTDQPTASNSTFHLTIDYSAVLCHAYLNVVYYLLCLAPTLLILSIQGSFPMGYVDG